MSAADTALPRLAQAPRWLDTFSTTLREVWRRMLPEPTASTAVPGSIRHPLTLDLRTLSLFSSATDQVFEDGMETQFSMELVKLITVYGNPAVDSLARLILSGRTNAAVGAEALRWLPRIDQLSSYERRLWLLECCLTHPNPQIRDAAALGIAAMDDPRAIRYVHDALGSEDIPEIREFLEQVAVQLGNTRQCRWF